MVSRFQRRIARIDPRLLAACLLASASVHGDIAIDLDGQVGSYHGFGAQIWPGQEHLEPAFDELGMNLVRWAMPELRECPVTDASVADYRDYFARETRFEHLEPLHAMLRRNNVFILMNGFHVPLAMRNDQEMLADAHVRDYARMWAGAMLALRERDLLPDALEALNEPDGKWSGRVEPEDYNRVVRAIARLFERHNIGIQLVGPGIAHIDLEEHGGGTDLWVEALDRRGVEALDIWSIHGYVWQRTERAARVRETFRSGFLGAIRRKAETFGNPARKPILITEYGSFATTFHGDDHPSGKEHYGEPNVTDVPAWGVRVIENSLSFLNHGAGGLIYWQLACVPWEEGDFGIYTRPEDGSQPQMIYHAFRSLTPHIPKGARVLRIDQPGGDLYAAAFQKEDRLVVAVVNRGQEPEATELAFEGADRAWRLRAIHRFADGGYESTDTPPPASRAVELPGDSTATLVFEARQ